ncbi:MAG: SOS-response repressor and protease LexA [Evtepia sp.]|jgi:repressor LexA|nr:SOS-response repressor and protease LexA [Evtepia sp.]
MGKLTAKQQEIYDYILLFIEEYGYPPSVREIGDHLGLKSPSTVHFHLKGLRSAGLIHQTEGKTRSITVTAERPSRRGKIPVLGNVAAGSPILAQECVEEYLSFQLDQNSDEHFALRVRGESMLGAGIFPGDLVVVKPQEHARNGEIVVALFEEEATVKTFHQKDGKIWLMPENPMYEPIDGDLAKIIGKVVAVVRRY